MLLFTRPDFCNKHEGGALFERSSVSKGGLRIASQGKLLGLGARNVTAANELFPHELALALTEEV